VLNRSIGTCVDASATFDAFPYVFYCSLAVDKFKDLNGACGHAFTCAFTFIIVDGYGDIAFFKFFLHSKITSFAAHSVTTAIILDFLFTTYELVKKYQGSFIKNNSMRNQKTNQHPLLFFMHEVIL
jgi:hypothetical protein